MHLLFINYEYPPIGAGAATATAEMARSAARLGHEVTVLTSGFRDNFGWSHDGEVTVRRVRSRRERVDQSSIGEMASFVMRAALVLPGVVRRSRAQACIVYFSMPCGPLGTLFRLLSGGPYVVSLRGGDVPGTEPQLLGLHRWLKPVRRFVLSRALAVVANSPGLATLSERADPIAVKFIPNGVDLERFRPSAQRPPEPFHFLFVGRLNEQKNVGVLLEAVAELSRTTALPFRVSIVGDGPLRGSLRQRASVLGLDALVDWVQWLPREQMPALYRSAHCVINPSRYEGMPNVVLEAMACAIPVIVSDVAGNRDLVENGKNGFVVPCDSPGELKQAMALALGDQPGLEILGAGARRCAERHSWDAATVQYIDLLARGLKSAT